MLYVVDFYGLTLIIVIIILFVSVLFAIKFQKKQKNKYNECIKLIKEKEKGLLDVNNGMSSIDLKKIDANINADKLMMNLYDTYLEFIEKLNKNDKNFDGILDGFIKEFYEKKVDIYKSKNHFEITDNIELVNYSILEYNKEKIKFRVNITCFNYKISKEKVISGSNIERVDQIFILTYNKSKKSWLISNIEKVFEKKLSI